MVHLVINNLEIKEIGKEYFSKIRDLENVFLSRTPNNEYTLDDDNFYQNSLFSNGGLVLGVFDNGKLVGVSGSFILSSYEYKDVFVDMYQKQGVKIIANETVFFNNTLIEKSYRGRGLQSVLRNLTVKIYNKRGIFAFISTTSSNNIGSIKSLEKVGMKLVGVESTPYSKKPKNLFYMWKY